MTSITYIGMDVHTTNFTFCSYSLETDAPFAQVTLPPVPGSVVSYIQKLRKMHGDSRFLCGYEAGCLGYALYHQLTALGIECVIMAPSTMPIVPGKRVKNDRKDAANIARCLAYGTYKRVYVPDDEDNAVKEYIRMRDDVKQHLKSTKQQIIAFTTRLGCQFDGKSYWTQKHLKWLRGLSFSNPILKEVLSEYLAVYDDLTAKLAHYDRRIEEFSHSERYEENVVKLQCFPGIATHTAMSLLTEVGDFSRFKSAPQFAAYLGLVPGEHSSGDKRRGLGITKAGNCHLRRLLVESAQSYSRGAVCKKSKALLERQAGNPPEVIAYADKAAERLKRKFQKISAHSKHNVAKTAVARELACFVWGMMTDHIEPTA